MKNNTLKSILSCLVFIFTYYHSISSQSILIEVPLAKKIDVSDLVVEGKVISQQAFWNSKMTHIYTSNKIEVYKIFKGNVIKAYIDIITLGGVVGLQAEKVSPSLQFKKGNIGLFFVKKNRNKLNLVHNEDIIFMPSTGIQSFYSYNLPNGTANGLYKNYVDIKNLYVDVYSKTNIEYKEIKKINVKKLETVIKEKNQAALDITSFSPNSISAGTKKILTIDGSGFGTTKGNVMFKNASTGIDFDASALESEILTWTDVKVTVEVPQDAGTGKIQILTDGGTPFNSSSDLIVTFAEINLIATVNDESIAFMVQHADIDEIGGYTWKMHDDFDANSEAKASFIRAMDSWRCSSQINWQIDGTSTIDVIEKDGTNIIRFDNDDELSVGTAGLCTSYYSGCSTPGIPGIVWYVEELDIVFDDLDVTGANGTNWQFGEETPSFAEYDFESVAVHELGHGHQLGHVIDTGDFMHRELLNGQSVREVNSNNLTAAEDVQSRSINFTECGQSAMGNFICNKLSVEDNLLANQIILFPSYTERAVNIKNSNHLPLREIKFWDVRGKLVRKEKLINLQTQNINIEKLNSGLYYVQIITDNGVFSKKLIVK